MASNAGWMQRTASRLIWSAAASVPCGFCLEFQGKMQGLKQVIEHLLAGTEKSAGSLTLVLLSRYRRKEGDTLIACG